MTDKTDALVAALRELRDTGDVSDWRAMETALTAAIEALAQQEPRHDALADGESASA